MLDGAASGPSGHALFVRDWRRVLPTRDLDASAFADGYARARLSWIALYLSSGAGGVAANRDPELGRDLARAGVATWASWGLPQPTTWRAELPRFLEHARALGASGLLVNPERAWLGKSNDAQRFGAALEASGLPIIVATYGTPQGFTTFPWSSFAAVADVGMPLLFDRDLGFSADYFERGMSGWSDRGFAALDVAGSTWAHGGTGREAVPVPLRGGRSKTMPELARHLAQLPRTPAAALWSPVPLTPAGLELVELWNLGDVARLEELGRMTSRELAGRSGTARAPRSSADVAFPALALAGVVAGGAMLFRRGR